MAETTPSRPAVLSAHLRDELMVYLQFRHWYRHNFAHKIVWSRLRPLADGLASLVEQFVLEMPEFEAAVPEQERASGGFDWQG
jgi:hypothetical protein